MGRCGWKSAAIGRFLIFRKGVWLRCLDSVWIATDWLLPDGETVDKWSPFRCQQICLIGARTVTFRATPCSSSREPGLAHVAAGRLLSLLVDAPFFAA